MDYANLFIKSIFIENMVFAYFLGMCSYLAVSKTVKTSIGMGFAVIFVLTITVPLNFLIDQYLLQAGALKWIGPEYAELDLNFLSFIMFIAVIASMVQLVEMIVEKFSPSLYGALGIYIAGYDDNLIENFENSYNTLIDYTNYKISIPNIVRICP